MTEEIVRRNSNLLLRESAAKSDLNFNKSQLPPQSAGQSKVAKIKDALKEEMALRRREQKEQEMEDMRPVKQIAALQQSQNPPTTLHPQHHQQQQIPFEKSGITNKNNQKEEIDLECERLKESYSRHRRNRQGINGGADRSTSANRFNQSLNATAAAQNLNPRQISKSPHRHATRLRSADKENSVDGGAAGSVSLNLAGNQNLQNASVVNRFKRKSANEKSIANFKEKYTRLEENFKKFTQGLQEKRSTSVSLRQQNTNYQSAPNQTSFAANQNQHPNPSETFSPHKKMARNNNVDSTMNQDELMESRMFNPVGLSHQNLDFNQQNNNNPAMLTQSQLNVKRSVNFSAFGGQILQTIETRQSLEKDHLSRSMLDTLVEESRSGESRVQILGRLIEKMNHFMEESFSKIMHLSISKQQEHKLLEIRDQIRNSLQASDRLAANLADLSDRAIASECQKLQEIYGECARLLSKSFEEITQKIYTVDSETFKNYKFKDTARVIEAILSESHRLNLYAFVPHLVENAKMNRIVAASSLLKSVLTKAEVKEQKRTFVTWRDTCGLQKFMTFKVRQRMFAQTTKRIFMRWQNRDLSRFFLFWRQKSQFSQQKMMLTNSEGTTTQVSLLEQIFLNSNKFRETLASDQGMAHILSSQMRESLQIQTDILFLGQEIRTNPTSFQTDQQNCSPETSEEEVLTGYDADTGCEKQVSHAAVKDSLTAEGLVKRPMQQGQTKLFTNVFSNKRFDEQIDVPLLPKQFLENESLQNLNMLLLPLRDDQLQLVGLLRIFSQQKISETFQSFGGKLAEAVGLFCQRIRELRNSIDSLHFSMGERNEQITMAAMESLIHTCVFEVLRGIHKTTSEEFFEVLRAKANQTLEKLIVGTKLRLIFDNKPQKQRQFSEIESVQSSQKGSLIGRSIFDEKQWSEGSCIARQRDHSIENQEVLEDFMDYRQGVVTHQVSIATENLVFVFHKQLDSHNFVQAKDRLQATERFALLLFCQCLEPVLLQGIKIHEELTVRMKAQQKELVRQVSVNSLKESLRTELSSLYGLTDEETYEKFTQIMIQSLTQTDLLQNCSLVNFSAMLNTGIISGEPLGKAQLFAILTDEQNELLNMPQSYRLDDTSHDNLLKNYKMRYQASQEEYVNVVQEIQHQDKLNLTVTLPIYTDKSLVALLKAQFFVSGAEDEKFDQLELVQDMRALLGSIQLETARTLNQVIFLQASQNYNFRECVQKVQAEAGGLKIDLDFVQTVQSHLINPFTRKPSPKQLGNCLENLAEQILPLLKVDAISLVQEEQVLIGDIRKLNSRSIGFAASTSFRPDLEEMLKVDYNLQEQSITMVVEGDERAFRNLLFRFRLGRQLIEEAREESCDFIVQQCEVFRNLVGPFVRAALKSFHQTAFIPVLQEKLPRVLEKVVFSRKIGYIYNFFSRLKGMQVHKVPIFTRLRSYQAYVRRNYDNFGIEERIGYDENEKRETLIRQHLLGIYSRVFKNLNRKAQAVKKSYLCHFKDQVLNILQRERVQLEYRAAYQPTKLQRKSIGLIYKNSKRLLVRAYFTKFAVRTKKYARLNNPYNKELASALCLFVNYNRFRQRSALQKLRANAAERYYRDFAGAEARDREFMLQLARCVLKTNLDSVNGNQVLEEGFTEVLERGLGYLQQQMFGETLDVILVTVQATNDRKARAYVFNNKLVQGEQNQREAGDFHRFDGDEVIDGVTSNNMAMLVENLQGLRDFTLNFKRDVILQMLQKSQSAFNFGNICQSLYQLYLNKASQVSSQVNQQNQNISSTPHKIENEMASRMMLIRRSKSSLIVPLLMPNHPENPTEAANDPTAPQYHLAGSLELYRFHYQPFDEDIERRIATFAKILSHDMLPIYFQLRQSQVQIDSLRRQIQRNSRPVTSLSTLLRQVYFNAPIQLNAAQILPIIIESHSRTAYFYLFKDNHIYNFAYETTFIGELVHMGCVLELASNNDQQQSHQNQQQNSDLVGDLVDQQQMSTESDMIGGGNSLNNDYVGQDGVRRRSVQKGNIRSVTNERFTHILYYPVLVGPTQKVRAIVEVAFNDIRQVPQEVACRPITDFLDTFGGQLTQLEQRIRTFTKFTEGTLKRVNSVKKTKMFARWKSLVKFDNQRQQFADNQRQTMHQTEATFKEYVKSLESYDSELKKLAQEREELKDDLARVNIDRTAKYKFLGAALMLANNLERANKRNQKRLAFNKWRVNQNVGKIAETAFNKILELNHKHSQQRFQAACFLLQKSVGKQSRREAFEKISQFATMSQLRYHRTKNFVSSSYRTSIEHSIINSVRY